MLRNSLWWMVDAFKLVDGTAHTGVLDTWTVVMLLMTAIAYQIIFRQMPLTCKEDTIILKFLKIYTMSLTKFTM